MKAYHLLYIPLLLGAAACQDPSFSVDGEIDGADGKTILLEKADNAGMWVALDSTKIKGNGRFSFKGHAPAAPEIYRLSLDGNYIYFPVDSIESITVKAPAASFATGFTLSGSDNAVAMERFEKELIAVSPYLNIPDSAKDFKRRVFSNYLQNAHGSVVSYYILTKTVNGKPLFDTTEDARFIAAVATSFREFRPGDPRCALLEKAATEGMRELSRSKGRKVVMEADEVALFPISLPDENGRNVALADIVGGGTPTLLVFSDLSDPDAMKLNSEIKKITDSGKAKVYSVGLDADHLTWRNAAKNLSWTTVHANVTEARDICAKYNVGSLPTFFIIDAGGSLSARPASIEEASKLL